MFVTAVDDVDAVVALVEMPMLQKDFRAVTCTLSCAKAKGATVLSFLWELPPRGRVRVV